ncbi:MAG: cation:proton antiporter, partial [Planctomycetota bacterium]
AFVSAAVAIILFEGGLSLQLSELLHAGAGLRRLILLGVPVTAIGASLSIHVIMDMSWQISVLAGTLLVVTGPTVIVPLLQLVKPVGRVGGVVKWEGILNDPIGAIAAVVVPIGPVYMIFCSRLVEYIK